MTYQQAKIKAQSLVRKYPRELANNGRVGRAIDLVAQGRYKQISPTLYEVVGSKGNTYLVDIEKKSCECSDCEKGNLCYHRIAVGIVLL